MANMFDYLDWRGDIPMFVDGFNEVDNLILSEIAYVDFEGVLPERAAGPQSVELTQASERYCTACRWPAVSSLKLSIRSSFQPTMVLSVPLNAT